MSTYKALIKRLELRPIKSEAGYDAALEIAEELLLKLPNLNEDEEDYLKILSDLIGEYENIHHALSPSTTTPLENLKFLMNQNNLRQADLAKLLRVSSGRASEIWNGHRELSKTNVAILAEHFCVNASLFLPRQASPQDNSGPPHDNDFLSSDKQSQPKSADKYCSIQTETETQTANLALPKAWNKEPGTTQQPTA